MVPSTLRPFLGQMLAVLTVSLVAPCARGDVAINTLISFNLSNGNQPSAGLVQGPDGAFYGTTQTGGLYNQGTVFKIASNGAFTNLLSFSGITGPYPGANPAGNLVLGVNGNFYGTTESGGASNNGTLFEVTPTGGFTNLISFTGTNGSLSWATIRRPASFWVQTAIFMEQRSMVERTIWLMAVMGRYFN